MLEDKSESVRVPVRRPAVLRWLIVLFVFSTVFDAFSLEVLGVSQTVSRLVGIAVLVLFTAMAPRFRPGLRWNGKDLKWFSLFFVITAAEGIIRIVGVAHPRDELIAYFTYIQLFGMFLILRDVTRDVRAYRSILRVFLLMYVSAAVLTLLDVPFLTATGAGERIGLAGSNVNMLAFVYAVIAVFLITWLVTSTRISSMRGLAAGGAAAVLVMAIARTGSRGGVVALATGLFVAIALNVHAKRAQRTLLLLPLILSGVLFLMRRQEIMVTRLENSLSGRDLGGRDWIAEVGLELVAERPLAGYGAMYPVDLGAALGLSGAIAAHNTYLQMLLSFGLIGSAPFFLGVAFVWLKIWKHRESVWGSMWVAILTMILVFAFAAHLGDSKYFWMTLALASNLGVMAVREGARADVSREGGDCRRRWKISERRDEQVGPLDRRALLSKIDP